MKFDPPIAAILKTASGPQRPGEHRIDQYSMHLIHKAALEAMAVARSAKDRAHLAYHEAQQSCERVYSVLAKVESELLEFEERTGTRPAASYFTVKDEDGEDSEHA